MTEIAVIYLAWAGFPDDQHFRNFIDSYKKHPAGIEHDLIICFKGFPSREDGGEDRLESYYEYCQDLPFVRYWTSSDSPTALDTQGAITRYRVEHSIVCHLNSYANPLADDWLKKFRESLTDNVGCVAAMGSYEVYQHLGFDPFPNAHLRPSSFMMRSDLLREIWPDRILNKEDDYRWESGQNGLTKTCLKRGLKTLVVGRDGVYDIPDWPKSRTFRSGDQENLLLSDNHSTTYQNADANERERLAFCSWRGQA